LEPSGIGFATYVIGYSTSANALRTYKVERIVSVEIRRTTFDIPENFPGLALLQNAWSIYYGEQTIQVVLRFSPEVARRVKETNWRTASAPQPDPDLPNYLRLTFEVADTTDLKPWIRTWGANVEVLAPQSLRDEMIGEARALGRLYGWFNAEGTKADHDMFDDLFGDK
jgi:proteasome accessory factor B